VPECDTGVLADSYWILTCTNKFGWMW